MMRVSTPPAQEFSVRRSARARRVRLTVSSSGEVVVVLPQRASLTHAARLVAQHQRWLDRHLARVRLERSRLAARPRLGEGRWLFIAGEATRISAVDAVTRRPARGRVEAASGGLIVRLGRDGRETAALLETWLRDRARREIGGRIVARAAEMGVQPGRLSIRDQSSRWASASASGALSFSWRLILTPPFVLDAVVVHELAHLLVRGHDRRFWSIVRSYAPRTDEARRWLRAHAREVREALDEAA